MATGGQGCFPKVQPLEARVRLALAEADCRGYSDEQVARKLGATIKFVDAIRKAGELEHALDPDEGESTRLRSTQAAWILGVTERRLRQYVYDGMLDELFPEERQITLRKGDVIKFGKSYSPKCGQTR